jgi:hypothetical protein
VTAQTDDRPATPWLREAFGWRRLVALFLFAGFAPRVVTGFVFESLSIPRGWSGIVTLVLMYVVQFVSLVKVDDRISSLLGIAVGRDRAWPAATRRGVALTMAVAFVPIAAALATMPESGPVVDDVTGVFVAAGTGYFWLMVLGLRAREGHRRPTRSRRARPTD